MDAEESVEGGAVGDDIGAVCACKTGNKSAKEAARPRERMEKRQGKVFIA